MALLDHRWETWRGDAQLLSGKDLMLSCRSVVEWLLAVISPGLALQTAALLEVTSVLGGTHPLMERGSGTEAGKFGPNVGHTCSRTLPASPRLWGLTSTSSLFPSQVLIPKKYLAPKTLSQCLPTENPTAGCT